MNPTHREPRGTAGYTERHVFLSSRSPHAPLDSLLDPLSLRFSLFFLSLLSFLELRWITDNFSFGKFGFNGNGCSITSLPMDEESLSVFWNGFGERFDTLLSLLVAIIWGSICLYNLDIDYLIVLLDSMFGFDGLWYFDYYSEKLYLSRRNLDFLKESF